MTSPLASTAFIFLTINCILSACAISQAAERVSVPKTQAESTQPIEQITVSIDWQSANADANANDSATTRKEAQPQDIASTLVAVPLLLPPDSITLSDALPVFQNLSEAQVVTDKRGYSAVIQAETFTILIDASNQTFVTEQQSGVIAQPSFDGEYQQVENGGQITIGRYGALYATQLLCLKESLNNCITERMVREVIESLVVTRSLPE